MDKKSIADTNSQTVLKIQPDKQQYQYHEGDA